ncbi:MAG: hypothetical protein WCA85_35460 [Paraburkholderia sp.]|uniref:hypothetical protein n=1 Tax=Paraburkholderia sp. TaxID=1926495 RepID=UPI003C317EEF
MKKNIERRPNSGRRRAPGFLARRHQVRRQSTMGIISDRGLCSDGPSKMSGTHSANLVHSELLHIRLVTERLSEADLDRSGLPRAYWRKRLRSIMQNHQLTRAQFEEIDRILGVLED